MKVEIFGDFLLMSKIYKFPEGTYTGFAIVSLLQVLELGEKSQNSWKSHIFCPNTTTLNTETITNLVLVYSNHTNPLQPLPVEL